VTCEPEFSGFNIAIKSFENLPKHWPHRQRCYYRINRNSI